MTLTDRERQNGKSKFFRQISIVCWRILTNSDQIIEFGRVTYANHAPVGRGGSLTLLFLIFLETELTFIVRNCKLLRPCARVDLGDVGRAKWRRRWSGSPPRSQTTSPAARSMCPDSADPRRQRRVVTRPRLSGTSRIWDPLSRVPGEPYTVTPIVPDFRKDPAHIVNLPQ